jgi:hypothetical protein
MLTWHLSRYKYLYDYLLIIHLRKKSAALEKLCKYLCGRDSPEDILAEHCPRGWGVKVYDDVA